MLRAAAGLLAGAGIAPADAHAPAAPVDLGIKARADLSGLEPGRWPVDPFGDPSPKRERPRRRTATIPAAIERMVAAGNRIARLPYTWGGGHGSFASAGYDCSGSVSYLLHAAGLLSTPMDSSELESYGLPGRGRYVTIYSNPSHALITIRGRRFDTIAFQETGTRWSETIGSTSGYTVRHPRGL